MVFMPFMVKYRSAIRHERHHSRVLILKPKTGETVYRAYHTMEMAEKVMAKLKRRNV